MIVCVGASASGKTQLAKTLAIRNVLQLPLEKKEMARKMVLIIILSLNKHF
jgi:uridine kinase